MCIHVHTATSLQLFVFLIADKVEVYHDIWMIGDDFLNDSRDSLFGLKCAAIAAKRPSLIPYMLKYFNTGGHFTTSTILNITTRMVNAFVDVLNARPKLPKYVLVIPDKDIVTKTKMEMGHSIFLGAALHSIIKQMDAFVCRRRTDLTDKKPGAAISDDFPKFIWVRMLK